MTPAPKRRGRPPGSGKPLGPRVGSNAWTLSRMAVGETLLVEVGEPGVTEDPKDRHRTYAAVSAHWQSYFARVPGATFETAQWLAVNPRTREVLDVLRITRSS